MAPRSPAKTKIKRFLPTTFNFKDVLVILTTAITAAAPFFAFDSKFGILENQIATLQGDADEYAGELKERDVRIQSLTEQLYHVNARMQVLEETRTASSAEIAQLNQKVVELKATLDQLRQRRR
jgi:septal ring factor EnvC (AmiA/AmiB activator)